MPDKQPIHGITNGGAKVDGQSIVSVSPYILNIIRLPVLAHKQAVRDQLKKLT